MRERGVHNEGCTVMLQVLAAAIARGTSDSHKRNAQFVMLQVLSAHLQSRDWWQHSNNSTSPSEAASQLQPATFKISLQAFDTNKHLLDFGVARHGSEMLHRVFVYNPATTSTTVETSTTDLFKHNGFSLSIEGDTEDNEHAEQFIIDAKSTRVLLVRCSAKHRHSNSFCQKRESFSLKFLVNKRFKAAIQCTVGLRVFPDSHSFWLQNGIPPLSDTLDNDFM